ncbi:invasion associated locus B family protein [Bradyrhizobium sp. HKCCYLS1011]|uniref:invasion associated locus B family protein n=1 Tax=Bradyrhizobium sp. HKCCYLS1011 TaxID=3420733 RepID=UPI003EBC3C54
MELDTAMRKLRRPALAGIMLLTLARGTGAQQPFERPVLRPALLPNVTQAQQAPTQGNVPQSTTATYADWVVQCLTHAGTPPEKVCEMAQLTQLQGKNVPFSRIAVGHPAKDRPIKLIVQLPVNASFATAVRIQTTDSDPGLTAPFARCVPGGCFAEFDLKEDTLKKLRAASGVGKLSFAEAGGQVVAVPLSFNGFAQAYEALLKE